MSRDMKNRMATRWSGAALRGTAVGAVLLALLLEIVVGYLDRNRIISFAWSRLLNMGVVLLAVGLPTYLVYVFIPTRSIRVSVTSSVVLLCLAQLVQIVPQESIGGRGIYIGIVTSLYMISVGLIMVSIYLAFARMAEAQQESRAERERLIEEIAERSKAEERLLAEKRFTDELLNSLPGIFYMYSEDGRLVRWNKNHETFTGYSAEELAGKQVSDWYDGPERDLILERVAETFEKGDARAIANLILKDGTRVPYEVIGHRLDIGDTRYLIGMGLDVSVRRQAEEALSRSEERFRKVAENAGSWIWEVDASGKYTYCSSGVERILGFTPDEVVGKLRFYDLFAPESRDELKQAAMDVFARRKSFAEFVNVNVHKDGRQVILATSGSAVLDDAGELRGYVGVDRDITQLMHLEEQLRQSQKMEAIGQLAGGVAHDFNNLLQAILGFTNLILEDVGPDDEHHEELLEVKMAAERASSLTRQLLAFSRRQVIQPVGLDLNDVVGSLMKMLKRLIGEHIELEVIPGHRVGTVHADKGQIEQVLMNLCVNARDAMPTGGRLTIETENILLDEEYVRAHPWANVGRYVLVSVTDTGCGMDRATQAHIFEPFYTTKKLGEGTGLGLSTVYGIVEQHGGMTQVYSEPGMGSTFKMYLPVWEHAHADTAEMDAVDEPGGVETILIAEDEEPILNLAARLLRSAGYTVITACDGEEALHLFDSHEGKIDLVMLDVVMPKLSGRDVHKRISERCPEMRFLFASGYSASALHTNFVLNEGMLLLPKPYHRNALLRKVREALSAPLRA